MSISTVFEINVVLLILKNFQFKTCFGPYLKNHRVLCFTESDQNPLLRENVRENLSSVVIY